MAKSHALLLSAALLAAPVGRADEPRRDWSRVQALASGQQIVVKPFKGMGPKVKGAYVSSDADRLIVRRQNGQEATIPKECIYLVARKRSLRNTVLIGTTAGPGRILFGSDSTYLSPGAQLAKIAFTDIGEEAKKQILASNARRVFGKSIATGKA